MVWVVIVFFVLSVAGVSILYLSVPGNEQIEDYSNVGLDPVDTWDVAN